MPRTSDPHPKANAWQGMGAGWTLLSELIAAIAVWGGIGFGLDRLFGTRPVLFAIGLVIGYAGGAYLIYRRSFAREAQTVMPGSVARGDERTP